MPKLSDIDWEDYGDASPVSLESRNGWVNYFNLCEGGDTQFARSGDSMVVLVKEMHGYRIFDCKIRRVGTPKPPQPLP